MKAKMSIGIVIGLALISCLGLHAQQASQWTATFTLPASSYILGEPIAGEIVLRNGTSAVLPSPGLFGAFYLDGETAPCRAYDAPPVERMPVPPPGVTYGPPSAPHMEPPGASKVFPVNISHLCFDRQARNPLGAHHLCFQWAPASSRAPLCVTFSVKAPSGVDAAAYQAFKGDPLAHPAELLQRFPTSTYAGYVLIHSGPGGSLSGFQKWWTMTARQRDDAWYVPQAASPAKQEARRQLVRNNYEGFVQRARAFLAIHPNFARADLLRKELANALFMLDQRDEALQEVQKLAKMSGPVAEEAQALLKESEPSSIKP